nr:nucleotide-binding alpha-beta plait domain-containing protein [Tanacetum cinerariifolium]
MVMSGSQRSKEDDVQKISMYVFVTNFPDGYGAKDLWNTYVVDVFIPNRRTKAGKRFGFVRFIKVLDIDRLINNLCMVWVGRNKIHANVARFQRGPLHKQSNKVNNKGTNNVNHGAKGMTNSYDHMVTGNQVQNVGMEECPNMVLDETCLNHEDFLLCLLGKVKEFTSLTNLKVVLGKEGYANIKLKYMGGFWVMIMFQDDETKKRFQFNLAVGSWFSQIIQAHNDFVIDERVIWVEVEGVPCKWWSRNTFSRIASRWGTLLNGEELEDEGYHSNRICIRTKLKTVVFDSFKMMYRGMTCWVRAIEVSLVAPTILMFLIFGLDFSIESGCIEYFDLWDSCMITVLWAFKICLGRSKPMVITKAQTLNSVSRSFLLKASASTSAFCR